MATGADSSHRRTSPLRRARLDRDMRQSDVAEAAGCSVPLVSMAEHGYIPAPATREAIAAAVGASAGSFWPA